MTHLIPISLIIISVLCILLKGDIMIKTLTLKKISISLVYLLVGFGMGIIASMPLVYFNIISDDASEIFLIAIPVMLIFFGYKFTTLFNLIQFTENSVIVKTMFHKTFEYEFQNYEMMPSFNGFSINGAPLINYLTIQFTSKHNKKKTFHFAAYSKVSYEHIIEQLVLKQPDLFEDHP